MIVYNNIDNRRQYKHILKKHKIYTVLRFIIAKSVDIRKIILTKRAQPMSESCTAL